MKTPLGAPPNDQRSAATEADVREANARANQVSHAADEGNDLLLMSVMSGSRRGSGFAREAGSDGVSAGDNESQISCNKRDD
jgi:hypothetical protein